MKQKIVVNVTMNGQKSRSKALNKAVGLEGVESASFKGDDNSQIEVIGDGVDPVQLTRLLRKRIGQTELVSVSNDAAAAAVEGDGKKEEEDVKPAPPDVRPYIPPYYVVLCDHEPSYCSIL